MYHQQQLITRTSKHKTERREYYERAHNYFTHYYYSRINIVLAYFHHSEKIQKGLRDQCVVSVNTPYMRKHLDALTRSL